MVDDADRTVMSGWLRKKNQYTPTYSKGFFRLRDGMIECTKHEKGDTLVHKISLVNAAYQRVLSRSYPFSFRVHQTVPKKRTFYFRAWSKADLEAWFAALDPLCARLLDVNARNTTSLDMSSEKFDLAVKAVPIDPAEMSDALAELLNEVYIVEKERPFDKSDAPKDRQLEATLSHAAAKAQQAYTKITDPNNGSVVSLFVGGFAEKVFVLYGGLMRHSVMYYKVKAERNEGEVRDEALAKAMQDAVTAFIFVPKNRKFLKLFQEVMAEVLVMGSSWNRGLFDVASIMAEEISSLDAVLAEAGLRTAHKLSFLTVVQHTGTNARPNRATSTATATSAATTKSEQSQDLGGSAAAEPSVSSNSRTHARKVSSRGTPRLRRNSSRRAAPGGSSRAAAPSASASSRKDPEIASAAMAQVRERYLFIVDEDDLAWYASPTTANEGEDNKIGTAPYKEISSVALIGDGPRFSVSWAPDNHIVLDAVDKFWAVHWVNTLEQRKTVAQKPSATAV